jgi:Ca2+-binding EF-hand superfamily protein
MLRQFGIGICALTFAALPLAAPSQAQVGGAKRPLAFDLADANKNGQIDRGEFRARMLEVFKALDTNGNGTIELVETPRNRKHVFPVADADNSQAVDQNEYLAYILPRFDDADENQDDLLTRDEVEAETERERLRDVARAFELTDADNNGSVDVDEFRTRYRDIFEGLDVDKNGVIDPAEVPEERRDVFPEVDTDGNQRVDQAEFMNYTTPRFDEADANKDRVLSLDEVEAAIRREGS